MSARLQGLLACILLHRQTPLTRQQLAGLLWPESSDAQALTNLRRELHHLRRVLPDGERYLEAESRTIVWRTDPAFELDVAEFEQAVLEGLAGRRDALERAARLYAGDLLPGCDDDWIRPERDRLRRSAIEALARLVDLLERERSYGEAIAHAERLLQLDPLDEGAWRALMRCHAGRGQRASALHAYQKCASVLQREVGAQPSAATRLVYRSLLENDDAEVPAAAGQTTVRHALVGRASEWATLLRAWRTAAAGRAAFVLVRGEAGIGKTRLAEELAEWCSAHSVHVSMTRCYAGEGRLAYGPVAAWLRSEALRPGLATTDAAWLTEAARLGPDLSAGRADAGSPGPAFEPWQRRRFFEGVARVFEGAMPLLLVLDDIQWCDSDTLEWLHFLLRFAPDAPCLVVGTLRSEEEGDNPAVRVLLRELKKLDRLTVVDLGPLDDAAAVRLAEEAAGRTLEGAAREALVRHCEGHPLFIVETARMGPAGAGPLPPRVQAVVAARLAQLSPTALSIAQLAATIGRDFAFDLLAAAADLDEDALVSGLDELWRRQVVREAERDRWDFTHDRIREVTYAETGPARRRLLHRRVAQALELVCGGDLDAASAAIASQFEQAEQPARAVEFFERAARVATRVCASEEAIRCLTRALAILPRLPASRDRDRLQLRLRRAVCAPLTTARGYSAREVEAALEDVIGLARPLADQDAEMQALWGLWAVNFVRGNLARSREIGERSVALAASHPSRAPDAHHSLGGTLASLGELGQARRELEAAIAASDAGPPPISAFGSNLRVFARAWLAQVVGLQGDVDRAGVLANQAIAEAEQTGHPYDQALAHAYATITAQIRGDVARVRASAEAGVALCERHGIAYYGDWARILLGWVRLQESRPGDALRLIRTGLDRLDEQGAFARRPYYLWLLAEACLADNDRDRAAAVLDAAVTTAIEREDRWWLPELHRRRGEIGPAAVRAARFEQALSVARAQDSRLLERRAAASLERWLADPDRTVHGPRPETPNAVPNAPGTLRPLS